MIFNIRTIFIKKKRQHNQAKYFSCGGFTLIEILVVLGLFSSVMVIAAGALFTTQSINIKLKESQSILDNINLSIDIMTRDIRYGSDFHCGLDVNEASTTLRKNCTFAEQGGTVLIFKPFNASSTLDRVAYYLDGDGILWKDEYTDIGGGVIATTTYQVTTDDVKINSMVFYVTGAYTTTGVGKDFMNHHDYEQPLVTLSLYGETKPSQRVLKVIVGEGSEKVNIRSVKFIVQTSISARTNN